MNHGIPTSDIFFQSYRPSTQCQRRTPNNMSRPAVAGRDDCFQRPRENDCPEVGVLGLSSWLPFLLWNILKRIEHYWTLTTSACSCCSHPSCWVSSWGTISGWSMSLRLRDDHQCHTDSATRSAEREIPVQTSRTHTQSHNFIWFYMYIIYCNLF